MEKEDLINQIIITKADEHLKILSAEGERLENLIIKTSDKKIYNLLLAYQSGFIRFEDPAFNEFFEKHLDEDAEEDFDTRFDEKFGTGTDVFSADEYLKRMKQMRDFEEKDQTAKTSEKAKE